jgi:hypothetical protein
MLVAAFVSSAGSLPHIMSTYVVPYAISIPAGQQSDRCSSASTVAAAGSSAGGLLHSHDLA